MNRLDGKVAFLSGAARGIGAATARLMVAAGAKVAIGDILDETGRKLAQEIGALYIHLDVTSEASWVEALDATVKAYGKLDVLVNNAGIFNGKGVEEASLDDWHKLVAVNLTGVVLGTRAALPHLKKSRGNIVNLASIAGLVGSQLDPLYSLTKGGVTLFTKSTALEFGRKGYKIRVNSIHPGVIDTDMGQQTFVMRAKQVGTNDTEKAREASLALHPIGRLGQATDIARHAQEIVKLKRRLNEIYARHTGQTLEAVEKALDRDTYMTPDEARAFGLIDEVVTTRPPRPDEVKAA